MKELKILTPSYILPWCSLISIKVTVNISLALLTASVSRCDKLFHVVMAHLLTDLHAVFVQLCFMHELVWTSDALVSQITFFMLL